MKSVMSPKEVAYAIGVSESSLKRWADDGRLRVSRTAGGHRRITIADAIRFIRSTNAPLVHPEVLGLPDVAAASLDAVRDDSDAERFHAYLAEGRTREARGLIMSLYLGGESVATIADDLIRPAMQRIGERWQHSDAGIFIEHRATDICVQGVQQLRAVLDVDESAPVAVGGAAPRDPYLLPSLLAASVLTDTGFRAINLGGDTPLDVLLIAARENQARLAWLSISAAENTNALNAELLELANRLGQLGTRMIVGGQRADVLLPPIREAAHMATSMAELAAFAKGKPVGRAAHWSCRFELMLSR